MNLAGVLASWAAVVVAVIVAFRAYISERRAKKSAEDAEELRKRTVAASERSANAIERVAEALREANTTDVVGAAIPVYQEPTWNLDHVSGSKYALVDNTPYTQTDVVITGKPIRRDAECPSDVAPFGEYQFLGLSAWGLVEKIGVTWTDNSGEPQTWSEAMPPKH